ncbi:DNA polymerase III subunit beta [Mesorhizobium sp. M7D.F.Ca.US.004.01.2.1]|uniref:DNA polymerase III subunit beta n=1 Tax=Mesorhizobium sp. M7D.F.Ca.US.004.01.2.1 TaxID=2496738 RepID=UPI000FCCB11E|nr:DNA polymerase III subunit beta [Mesorhizobium sp. M7D.F.Ca.US.004.01.2.1]RUX96473.1 DNA polymerase III subunit beta [Mesorhizobium sp. M7D.F.Ca.US.004.01.2.1]
MRVILERSNLLKSLNHVHRVVERRNTIPILSNVLLSAEGASLEMKATDLDLEVTEATPAKVERGGATTVPAHLLYDIVRKLADGAEVMLKTDEDGNAMTVTSGRSSFRLQCLPQSDFPELSAGSFSHIFRLDSVALRGLIEKTQFAISTEETRYYLNGIYLHTHEVGGKLKLRSVATDGHRLARAEIDAPAGSEGMPGIIIPRKTVSELQKLVDDPDVAVTTELSDTKIRFTIGSVVLTSKLSISEGQVTLAVNNPDSGSATEELAADYSSDPIEIGFNAKYLLDVAAQLTGTEAKFMLADAGSPTLIHDMADETALYVLMPMRV